MDNRNDEHKETQNPGPVRIDHMLDKIHAVETINVQDGTELLQEKLSDMEIKRLLNLALGKMAAQKEDKNQTPIAMPTNGKGKKRGLLVAAIATLCFFASTAVAAEIFNWDDRISKYLGFNQNNSLKLSKSGMNLDVAAEQNGVTIKAVQTLGDANNMYILFDVTTPEGTTIDANSGFEMIYLSVEGATSMGYHCNFLPDQSDSDNQAAMVLAMDANKDINDKTINLRFKDLRHYEAENRDYVTDVPGTWELEWKLDYEDNSVKHSVGQDLAVNGKTVKVDSVAVSPLAINVKVSGDYIKEYDAVPPDPEAGDLIQITAVTLKDGTVLGQEAASGWGTSIEGDIYTINMQMKKLIDQEQIKSITLNDTIIPLE